MKGALAGVVFVSLTSCTLGYPLATHVESSGSVLVTPRRTGPGCLTSIELFARPRSERQARVGPDSGPIWSLRARDGLCVPGFPVLRYGQVPEGMVETAPAPALVPGRVYWVRGYTGGGVYSAEFTAPPAR